MPPFLFMTKDWVDKNKNNILVNIVAAAIWLPAPWLLSILWKAVVSAIVPPSTLITALHTEIRVSVWVLPALFLLPLLLLHLSWYVRLYRYRADTVFGLDFKWLYSFPMGRVIYVRAFCPRCRKPALEPTGLLDRYDNYLCRNGACNYNTGHTHSVRMEYPWHEAIQRRVSERRHNRAVV